MKICSNGGGRLTIQRGKGRGGNGEKTEDGINGAKYWEEKQERQGMEGNIIKEEKFHRNTP